MSVLDKGFFQKAGRFLSPLLALGILTTPACLQLVGPTHPTGGPTDGPGDGDHGGRGGGGSDPVIPYENWVPQGGAVNAMVRSGDTLYLGGSFVQIGPLTGATTPIDLSTGYLSSSWKARSQLVSGTANAVISDNNGGWYVGIANGAGGGGIPLVSGSACPSSTVTTQKVLHFNADGSLDCSFAVNANVTNANKVNALALSGSTLFIGGNFNWTAGGGHVAVGTNLAALDATTGAQKFAMSNPGALGNAVNALLAQGTRLIVGGNFAARVVSRLVADGTSDPSWSAPDSPGQIVNAIVSDGTSVYYGINAAPGVFAANLADGTQVSGWPAASIGVIGAVKALAFNSDKTRLYAGGAFTAPKTRLMALNTSDGSVISGWDPGNGSSGTITSVNAMAMCGSDVCIGGAFWTISGQNRSGLAKIDSSGAVLSWNPGGGTMNALLTTGTSQIIVAGSPGSTGGTVARSGLAAVSLTTGRPTSWNPSPNGEVDVFTISGNRLFVAGGFSNIGGSARSNAAAFSLTSGTLDGTFAPTAAAADHPILAIAVSSTSVYVGGKFTQIAGVSRTTLAAFDLSGSLTAWDPGDTGAGNDPTEIDALAINGGALYVGGAFTQIGGFSQNYLTSFDAATGVTNTGWVPNYSGGPVSSLALQGSHLLVGGTFSLEILESDGTRIDLLQSDDAIRSLALSADGSLLYLGGSFTMLHGGADMRGEMASIPIAADGSLGAHQVTSFAPAFGTSGAVKAIVPHGSYVYAAGTFLTLNGNTDVQYFTPLDPTSSDPHPVPTFLY
jgi:hypothetical protein